MRLTRGGPRKQLMRTDLLCAVMRRRNLNEGPALARNAGNAGRGGPECPFRRIGAQCDGYSFTVGLRNRSRETISSVFVGWVFIPEGQSGCPTSHPTRYQQTVTLRPGDTTVLNIDTRFDGPSGPFRYCVALTGVDIVP